MNNAKSRFLLPLRERPRELLWNFLTGPMALAQILIGATLFDAAQAATSNQSHAAESDQPPARNDELPIVPDGEPQASVSLTANDTDSTSALVTVPELSAVAETPGLKWEDEDQSHTTMVFKSPGIGEVQTVHHAAAGNVYVHTAAITPHDQPNLDLAHTDGPSSESTIVQAEHVTDHIVEPAVQEVITPTIETATAIIDPIVNALPPVLTAVTGEITSLLGGATGLVEDVTTTTKNVIGQVDGTVQAALGTVDGLVQDISHTVTQAPNVLEGGQLTGYGFALVNAATNAVNAVATDIAPPAIDHAHDALAVLPAVGDLAHQTVDHVGQHLI